MDEDKGKYLKQTGIYLALFEPSQLEKEKKNFIVKFTHYFYGPFVHADVCIHPVDLLEAKGATIQGDREAEEMLHTTITKDSEGIVMGWKGYSRKGYYWVYLPCTTEQLLKVDEMSKAFVKDNAPKTYFNWKGFVRLGLRCPQGRPTEHTRGYFCSQYLCTLLQKAGILKDDFNPSAQSVTDLYVLCMEQVEGVKSVDRPFPGPSSETFLNAHDCYFKHKNETPLQNFETPQISSCQQQEKPPDKKRSKNALGNFRQNKKKSAFSGLKNPKYINSGLKKKSLV